MSRLLNSLSGNLFRRVIDYASTASQRRKSARKLKKLAIHPSVLDGFGEFDD